MIAKLDATVNDIPSPKFSVRGYPTLVFVTAKGDGECLCSRRATCPTGRMLRVCVAGDSLSSGQQWHAL